MLKTEIFIFLLFTSCFTFVFAFDSYDYIVVGGGTAGCVIAGRLSEDPNIKVLLIERGHDVTSEGTTEVPTVNSVLPSKNNSLLDIKFLPVETVQTYEPNGSKLSYSPFALGGGPAVSGSFWGISDQLIHDDWASSIGDSAFKWENLITYFKKAENVDPNQSSSPDRGRDGPIQITILSPNDTLVDPIAQLQSQAFNTTIGLDYNTRNSKLGIWPMQRSIKRDPENCNYNRGPCQRQTSYVGYVKPYLDRKNLSVLAKTNATKLITKSFLGVTRVLGVQYESETHCGIALAKRETIVSMGAFNSPKLLLLSGIGDSRDLKDLEIPEVVHLPGVGQNLQDHYYSTLAFYFPQVESIQVPSSVRISFFKSGLNGDYIDMEVAWGLVPAVYVLKKAAPGAVLIAQTIQVFNATKDGFIKLKSSDPLEPTHIQFNFDPQHLRPMVWSFHKVRSWISLAGGVELSPGAAVPANATDEQVLQYFSASGKSYFHTAGTCKMGRSSDPMAVVDNKFRVFGVKNLRVVDNSVQPVIVSTHPSATSMTLGEYAAKLILDDH